MTFEDFYKSLRDEKYLIDHKGMTLRTMKNLTKKTQRQSLY